MDNTDDIGPALVDMQPPCGVDLGKRFTYHPPKADQPQRYTAIRASGLSMATALSSLCPPSRELSLALGKIEEAVMWANASVARNE